MSLTGTNKAYSSKFFKGLRFRLTVVYTTLFGLFICIFAYLISVRFIEEINADFDSALLNYAIDLSGQADLYQHRPQMINIPEKDLIKHFPFPVGRTYFVLRSKTGEILAKGQKDMPVTIPYEEALAAKRPFAHRFLSLEGEEESYRAVNLKIADKEGHELILQVATPDSMLQEQSYRFILINLLIIPFLLVISSISSYLIAGKALNPIRVITEAVNNIAAKNLSLRVPEPDTGDEIEELSQTFNTLLNRLEKSFKAQESFVANASHQLNTPLSIIKGELDVLESKSRDLAEHEKFRKSLREEVDRLIELVRNMLLISRVEAGQENFKFLPVRLDETLLAVTSRLAPKARDKKITLRFNISEALAESDEVEVMGERQLLECLFENLLDNAIKYSPEDGHVSIQIQEHDQVMEVCFSDGGPGMDPNAFSKALTRRFQRGSNLIPGTGIGLPIALQIADYHQATISYEKLHPQGSLFKVQFYK